MAPIATLWGEVTAILKITQAGGNAAFSKDLSITPVKGNEISPKNSLWEFHSWWGGTRVRKYHLSKLDNCTLKYLAKARYFWETFPLSTSLLHLSYPYSAWLMCCEAREHIFTTPRPDLILSLFISGELKQINVRVPSNSNGSITILLLDLSPHRAALPRCLGLCHHGWVRQPGAGAAGSTSSRAGVQIEQVFGLEAICSTILPTVGLLLMEAEHMLHTSLSWDFISPVFSACSSEYRSANEQSLPLFYYIESTKMFKNLSICISLNLCQRGVPASDEENSALANG